MTQKYYSIISLKIKKTGEFDSADAVIQKEQMKRQKRILRSNLIELTTL